MSGTVVAAAAASGRHVLPLRAVDAARPAAHGKPSSLALAAVRLPSAGVLAGMTALTARATAWGELTSLARITAAVALLFTSAAASQLPLLAGARASVERREGSWARWLDGLEQEAAFKRRSQAWKRWMHCLPGGCSCNGQCFRRRGSALDALPRVNPAELAALVAICPLFVQAARVRPRATAPLPARKRSCAVRGVGVVSWRSTDSRKV